MKVKGLTILCMGLLMLGTLSMPADAANRDPASCLLYPYYFSIESALTVISVTNVCADEVHLRIVFVSVENDCLPKDYWRTLTGYDTFTFIDSALNQQFGAGFVYIYVVEAYGSKVEKKADCLIGQEFIFGFGDPPKGYPPGPLEFLNYGVNAVSFAVGDNTVNGDGKLMLDGNEYDPAPSGFRIPRYFGQNPPHFISLLYLINLTGGKYYEANVGIRIFDDSEHEFSDQLQIDCWAEISLFNTLPDTLEKHLQATSTDLDEIYDGTPPTQPHKKSGWIEVYGINAHYFINNFENPGIYGMLVEKVGPGFAADLPWEVFGPVNNAMLWSTSPDGN